MLNNMNMNMNDNDNESKIDSTTIKNLTQDGDVIKCGEKLIFNPYNSDNKEITLNDVQSILTRHGITAKVHNLELYKRAFVHRSYMKRPELENSMANIEIPKCPENCVDLKTKSNERLEFIGDGVLELITKYYLYRRFPKADEGFMTEKKIALSEKRSISVNWLTIWDYTNGLIISKHAEEKKIRTNLKKVRMPV